MSDSERASSWWSALFDPEPEQWGFRGDPFAWRAMSDDLADREPPADVADLEAALRDCFVRVVGVSIATERESVFVKEFAHGGMSSGHVHLTTWRDRLLPLLIERGNARL